MQFNQLLTSLKDPALQTRWRVRMPDEDYPFQVMAESVEFSTRNVAAKQRMAMGKAWSFPDSSTLDGITIVFYETYDWSVTNYLAKWDNLVRDENGNYGVPIDYEKTIVIEMLNYEDDSAIKSFEYVGVWPTEMGALSMTSEDPNGRVQITQQFAVKEQK